MSGASARDPLDLSGRVAVVTGGGGVLGRVFATALAGRGAAVAVIDVDGDAAAAVVADLAATGATTVAVACDVADPDAVAAMTDTVVADLGVPHVLVNNAATKTSDVRRFFSDSAGTDLALWREVMAVNLDGMFVVARAVGGRMVTEGRGSIVQTASIYGVVAPDLRIYDGLEFLGAPMTSPVTYSASKAGVVGLTRHLAVEWAPHGVRVNALVPGGVEGGQDPRFVGRYADRVPMGRMARPDELAGPLLFLATDASSYVTGQALAVDGGLTAW